MRAVQRFLNPVEVARLCKVSVESVYRWILGGSLPATKRRDAGGKTRYLIRRRDALERLALLGTRSLDGPPTTSAIPPLPTLQRGSAQLESTHGSPAVDPLKQA